MLKNVPLIFYYLLTMFALSGAVSLEYINHNLVRDIDSLEVKMKKERVLIDSNKLIKMSLDFDNKRDYTEAEIFSNFEYVENDDNDNNEDTEEEKHFDFESKQSDEQQEEFEEDYTNSYEVNNFEFKDSIEEDNIIEDYNPELDPENYAFVFNYLNEKNKKQSLLEDLNSDKSIQIDQNEFLSIVQQYLDAKNIHFVHAKS
ncbi:hypothetical protein HANVADRAFT_5157 [Hanseniaspora valbyensis NRRL Y-1626]|uniref:EF-hand domain-containing protein n=1 Tax=Hanseniaspora valbyensis NRRL Y-1626 TaxID=766949 RepID=A0A1B7TJJ4_9ASCO|nr:hypothetical protein HANVADRAFT_5157 [Hanseniaspora valbyensis NRRL Y-1626]